jgi:hypothetical protein
VLSVIVPTRDRLPWLKRTLAALQRQVDAPAREAAVVALGYRLAKAGARFMPASDGSAYRQPHPMTDRSPADLRRSIGVILKRHPDLDVALSGGGAAVTEAAGGQAAARLGPAGWRPSPPRGAAS